MYGASSPIFDAPELPSLRRMKPLPKRRRTQDEAASYEDTPSSEVALPELLSPAGEPDASTQGLEEALSAQLRAGMGTESHVIYSGKEDT